MLTTAVHTLGAHNQGMCVVCDAVLWLHFAVLWCMREGERLFMGWGWGGGGGGSTVGAEGVTEREREREKIRGREREREGEREGERTQNIFQS